MHGIPQILEIALYLTAATETLILEEDMIVTETVQMTGTAIEKEKGRGKCRLLHHRLEDLDGKQGKRGSVEKERISTILLILPVRGLLLHYRRPVLLLMRVYHHQLDNPRPDSELMQVQHQRVRHPQ